MKSIPAGLAAHLATGSTTLATALKVTRVDAAGALLPATARGFTTADLDATIDAVTYESDPGLDASNIVVAAGAAVGNLELTTLHDGTLFTTAEVLGGLWRNAHFLIFRYNWANPPATLAAGTYPLLAGTLGEIELREAMLKVELRDLRQYLQQAVGSVSSKNCRYRVGDAKCGLDITVPPFTMPFTVTGVTSNQIFTCSGRTEVDDYFGEGEVRFLTGENAGLSAKVKTFGAGVFTLALPMFAPVQVGDTGEAIVGDRKRLEEDCRDKFNNVLNFGGEPHRKGLNDIISPPDF